jgi:broad specificity phosphatase PhoE
LLIRHAETTNNANGHRFSGNGDSPITVNGRASLSLLRERLSAFPVEKVLTSNLQRAQETAELLFPNMPAQICDELTEFDFGDYTGVCFDELRADDPVLEQWRRMPGTMSFPGGQNIEAFSEDIWNGMHRLMSTLSERTICCIAHKTMGRLFIAKTLGLDLDSFRSIPMDNCSVSMITWDHSDGFSLQTLNMTLDLAI